MNKDFANNVTKLFQDIVTDHEGMVSVPEFITFLQRKEILPLRSYEENGHLKLVYYNVSLDVAADLSSMEILYTDDIVLTLNDLQHYDAFQLSEFVMALERDIPQWTHIWATEKQLARERANINERIKSILKEIRNKWIDGSVTDATKNACRIMYFNVKAAELMLQNGNPFWTNKRSVPEILDACQVFHVDAPIEQWLDSWNSFIDDCSKKKAEQERLIEERHIKMMKQAHLVHLKQLKLDANIRTIKLHHPVTLKAWNSFGVCGEFNPNWSSFYITLGIGKAHLVFGIAYNALDMCEKKVVEFLKRINDLAVELSDALVADGEQYFVAAYPVKRIDGEKGPFFIGQYSNQCDEEDIYLASNLMPANQRKEITECEHLASTQVINRINTLCQLLNNYIHNCEFVA